METHNETPRPAGSSMPAKLQSAVGVLDLSVAGDFLTTIDPEQRITYQTFDDDRKQKRASLVAPVIENDGNF
jgi:hypothetical protein